MSGASQQDAKPDKYYRYYEEAEKLDLQWAAGLDREPKDCPHSERLAALEGEVERQRIKVLSEGSSSAGERWQSARDVAPFGTHSAGESDWAYSAFAPVSAFPPSNAFVAGLPHHPPHATSDDWDPLNGPAHWPFPFQRDQVPDYASDPSTQQMQASLFDYGHWCPPSQDPNTMNEIVPPGAYFHQFGTNPPPPGHGYQPWHSLGRPALTRRKALLYGFF
ncbi:hypothetical protein JCM3766R1_004313 [Sporobolomyces carnicolor]